MIECQLSVVHCQLSIVSCGLAIAANNRQRRGHKVGYKSKLKIKRGCLEKSG